MANNRVNTREVIPQSLAIKSMRDSGYKSTAHAVAELIDNSVQAEASVVEVFIVEEKMRVNSRERWRITDIAVVDNGTGMDDTVLSMALQFGNGTHLNDRTGIGRFGMGIPNSSISQCTHVDIWTWQAGAGNAISSYLDVEQIEKGELREVPVPQPAPLPDEWRRWSATADESESGTVVRWTDLDRVTWKGSKATLDNIEFLVGRIYRRFITDDGLVIRLAVIRDGELVHELDRATRVNDPLYLSAPSSTPAPFDTQPMFQPYGRDGMETFPIEFKGENYTVQMRFSYATDAARVRDDGKNPGDTAYGKHAKNNVGVSILREKRELDLDTRWANRDLRERWWGAEIEFPAELDEVFGVTNNKQYATLFSEMADFFSDDEREVDWSQIREEWLDDGDLRVHLIDICNRLVTHIAKMRVLLRQQTSGARTDKQSRHEDRTADRASEKFRQRQNEGYGIAQDDAPLDKKAVEDDLVNNKGYASTTARSIADAVEANGRKVIFVNADNAESPSFFAPDPQPGVTEIVFNTSHPAHKMLVETLDADALSNNVQDLQARLYRASDAMRMLLCAWARYEMEEKAGPRRQRVAETRQEWGKMARQFLEDLDEDL
ncbi:ATP-binding protein [Gordonia amicalis]|uniref:ATP-binding protein n=1 Tax=Gordonia amicalis TaxID=89053 RepID=UPI00200B53A6|nr:ATP-binding protein [Gordonia amicalis]UPW14573.1 ATP-binding protein [Gordonia amicalis]